MAIIIPAHGPRLFLNTEKHIHEETIGISRNTMATKLYTLNPSNVGIQADLWQAQPDTGSRLE